MSSRWHQRAVALALAALSYALALWQRPGIASSDTKIDMHVDPAGFLGDVASVWTSSGSLGNVQGGQYGGYLWPMGPFFALGRLAGLAPWLVDRLWLGTLLALAAYGTVRLLDELLGRPRGVAHVVAGALVVLNPYVVVFTNRTTITLLAYALLPWLLLAVHRGVRDERRWLWPAFFALALTTTGGGVNAAVTAWLLVGPALLLLYEPLLGSAHWRAVRGFAWRAALLAVPANAWWIVPVLIQTRFGINFLPYTEQVGTIWGTTSATESLRLMGYWPSYIAVGFSGRLIPYFDDSHTMLFALPVVLASLLVPGLALAGFVWTRRWRYGPFFLLLALVGLMIMVAGFPEGTLLRRGLTFAYYRVEATQFLRTSYKAAPLLALSVACMGGAAAGEAWRRVGSATVGRWHGALAGALGVAAAALLAGQAWPLVTGRGADRQLTWHAIPSAWTRAGSDLDRQLPANRRAMVLPGQLFAYYDWGGTVDPILPVLTDRPVAVRSIVPYADLHAIDLQWTTDALVQQRRLLPGQLRPLLELQGVGAVIVGADDDRARSGALQPAEAARELGSGQGLGRPARRYGPVRRFGPEPGKPGSPVALPQVRRYDLRSPGGIVRVEPSGPETIVDGSASTLAGLAAFGPLSRREPLLYAGDQTPGRLREAATRGAEVVVGDGNRRRVFVASRLAQNLGWTTDGGDSFSVVDALLDPFAGAGRGSDAQTVEVLDGARFARAPFSSGFSQFPEHRPFAAFDGDPRTAWLADPSLEPARRWVELGFIAPRDVPWVEVTPYGDARGVTRAVEIGGRRFPVRPGVNRLPVRLRGVDRLRVRIAAVSAPPDSSSGAGGIAEVRVPGLRVREALRPPVLAERALAGRDLRRVAFGYVFERTTGDDPFRRGTVVGPAQARQVRDAQDAETEIARRVEPPVPRAYTTQAWATVSPAAPDSALDRLTGLRGAARFDGSSRWLGRPAFRASSAFDGDRRRGWVAGYLPGRTAWLQWTSARPATVRVLRLGPPPVAVATPSLVRLRAGRGASPALRVHGDGRVHLPRPLRGRSFRLEVLAARPPFGFGPGKRRAVGIGELSGPGIPRVAVPRAGPLGDRCGSVRVTSGRSAVGLLVEASIQGFDAGAPLRARGCGELALRSGAQTLRATSSLFRTDLLRLRSPAPAGLPPPVGGGRVEAPGDQGRGRWKRVRVFLDGPSWLVLGESYSRGWRASCDGRSLGAPMVIDGFANGWRAPADCRRVSFAFAPNRWVAAGYAVSALACASLLLLILLAWRRRSHRPSAARAPVGESEPASLALRWALLPALGPPPRWSLPRALAAGMVAASALGFTFGVPAGVLLGLAIVVVAWLGVSARALTLAAGALLVVMVPLLYLLRPLTDHGGLNFQYGVERIDAHWAAVGALVALAFALVRTLADARSRRSGPRADELRPPARRSERHGPNRRVLAFLREARADR